jgi:hypothetical protein
MHPCTLFLPLKFHTTTTHMLGYQWLSCHTSSCAGCTTGHHWKTTLHQNSCSFWVHHSSCTGHKVKHIQFTLQVQPLQSTTAVQGVRLRVLPLSAWLLNENHPCAALFDLVNSCTFSAALTARRAILNQFKFSNEYFALLCTSYDKQQYYWIRLRNTACNQSRDLWCPVRGGATLANRPPLKLVLVAFCCK